MHCTYFVYRHGCPFETSLCGILSIYTDSCISYNYTLSRQLLTQGITNPLVRSTYPVIMSEDPKPFPKNAGKRQCRARVELEVPDCERWVEGFALCPPCLVRVQEAAEIHCQMFICWFSVLIRRWTFLNMLKNKKSMQHNLRSRIF